MNENRHPEGVIKNMKKRSFTFIETLVVVSVIGLIFPVVFTILFIILQQQLKIFRLTEVKRQGDYIVSFMENVIKDNAYTIYDASPAEICEASDVNPFPHNGTPDSFQDKYKSIFSLDYDASKNLSISHTSSPPAPTLAFAQGRLNSSKVIIDSFSIACSRTSAFSAPLVSLNFTVCFKMKDGTCNSPRPEENASFNYQTSVKLRTFPTQ